ncbi:capsid protein [Helicoverpa armigera granulovirus]|uniref:Capsid protein n=1 Tax=Helicoverpa armigera granulovirus TaxID=489830 RepID=A9YMJ4_9BBAC|nr:capsid protein [Helicoverpa armigera granulovirus]ABY47693.1 capsid protein [Helicoverpa armigera granulovirus]
MDLLEFIVNSGFRADGRQAIMRMRRNYDLKKQLESDVTHVQFNMEQCDEFLNTLLQMFEVRARPPVYVAPQQPLYNHVITIPPPPPVFTRPVSPPPPPTPTPIPRSRRSSYMSVDFQDVPDFSHVIETDRLVKDTVTMPPPPPPPPPPQLVIEKLVTEPMPTADKPPGTKPKDYLDEIKKGVVLKKVPPKSSESRKAAAPAEPIMLAIRNKLDQRRQVTELSDHSEYNSDWSN